MTTNEDLQFDFELTVTRSDFKSPIIAVVSGKVKIRRNENRQIDLCVKSAITQAVTKWVQTKEGKPVFEFAGEDLNIGDLVTYGAARCEVFKHLLEEEGITDLKLSGPFQPAFGWSFDSVLVDCSQLPEC